MRVTQTRGEARRLCTIAARNYGASVRLLVETFAAHHADVEITVLFVDATGDECFPDLPCEVLSPEALPIARDDFLRMATYYDVTELSTSLKPLLLRHLLDRGAPSVMYLDPDIEVFSPLDDLFELAEASRVVLTPHVMSPMPRDGLNISEETLMASGQFNLGFVAVDPGSRDFLDYWWERTRLHALSDHTQAQAYFVDQRWVDAVPVLFEHAQCRDPACNVAYWNLHERELEVDEHDRWSVDGSPLRFFHYSGHLASDPGRLSKYVEPPERIDVAERPALQRLLRERSARMLALESESGPPPYRWKRAPNGLELTKTIRRIFWAEVRSAEVAGAPAPQHAFGADGGQTLTAWLLEPAAPGTALTRFQHAIWGDYLHYQVLFPDPLGDDAARFIDAFRVDFTLLALTPLALRPAPRSVTNGLPGVNLVGYLDGEFGMATHGRMIARTVRASGIPMATTVLRPPEHEHRHAYPATMGGAPFRLNLLCMNADGLLVFSETPTFHELRSRTCVGVWAWEIGALPEAMRPAFDLVDEIWCASDHVRSLLDASAERPTRKHPLAIDIPASPPAITCTDLGLPADRFLFGFVFDYRSVVSRKNPLGLINAYRRAFAPTDGAALILKSINSGSAPEQAAIVEATAGGRADIHLLDHHLDDVEMNALFHLLDCYVSLHRSEGLGLTIASAMAAGTPAIATGWSGNLEFMDDEDDLLIPYTLVDVGPNAEPYPPDAPWAEPDLDAAADVMRRVFDTPGLATELGGRARAKIAAVADVDRAAQWFAERFATLTGIEVMPA